LQDPELPDTMLSLEKTMRSPFGRYILLQTPGWIIASTLVWGVQEWFTVSPWIAGGGLSAWILKDFVLYPFVRTAYEAQVRTGTERLIGESGVVHSELAPRGKVRINGELWSAEIEPGAQPIVQGEAVRILGAQGLLLIVTADSTSSQWDHPLPIRE